MNEVKQLIEGKFRENPSLSKEELYETVMKEIKKEWFLTEEELGAVEEEVSDRLFNY